VIRVCKIEETGQVRIDQAEVFEISTKDHVSLKETSVFDSMRNMELTRLA